MRDVRRQVRLGLYRAAGAGFDALRRDRARGGGCPQCTSPCACAALRVPAQCTIGGGGGKKRIEISEEKAAQCRNELLCYLVLTRLFHYLKKHDTLPKDTIEALGQIVRSAVERYGDDHRVKKSILRALPNMFTALGIPGMPMHTAEVESTIRSLFSPFRDSRKQLRSLVGMETASLQLTFIGMCRKNGVDPCEAYQRLLDDPGWGMTRLPKPPPARRRRRQ